MVYKLPAILTNFTPHVFFNGMPVSANASLQLGDHVSLYTRTK